MADTYSIEHIDEVRAFFARLDPLFKSHEGLTKKEIPLLMYWLEDTYQYLKDDAFFVNVGFECLITRLSRLINERPGSDKLVCEYFKGNPDFMDFFFRNTNNNFDHFRSREFCNILNGLGHLKIYPPEEWMREWYESTKKHISRFNHIDFRNSIHGFFLLNTKPDDDWLEVWFCDSQLELQVMEPKIAATLLGSIGYLKIDPPKAWLNDWMRNHVVLMDDTLSAREIFELASAFSIYDVRQNEKFCSEWFKASLRHMEEDAAHYSVNALLHILYADVPVPHEWLGAWQKKVIIDFDEYYLKENEDYNFNSLLDVARVLYALALMQCSLSYSLPILLRCKTYLDKKLNHIFQDDADEGAFRKIMFAMNYFKMIGFDLQINPMDYLHHMGWLTSREGIYPQSEKDVGNYLKLIFTDDLKDENDAYIEEICDCVDFLVPSQRLVIEVDGSSHYVDGKQNAITKVKTQLLEHAGYTVVRLHAKSVHNQGVRYIEETLVKFINAERKRHVDDHLNQHDEALN